MNVKVSDSANVAIRSLADADRRQVWSWFDHLKNWENDAHVREISQRVNGRNLYVLRTSSDIRILFTLEEDSIEVRDIVRRETLLDFKRFVSLQTESPLDGSSR